MFWIVLQTRFKTVSGSTYIIDNLNDTLQRYKADGDTNSLRQDGEPIDILEILVLEVGNPAVFILDIVQDGQTITRRMTTAVTDIWEE